MGPEADGSLGCQASGDVSIAETVMDLKPAEVGREDNTILWALVSPLGTLLLLSTHSHEQATRSNVYPCSSPRW